MPLAYFKNLILRINGDSNTPVYQQIANQIYCIISIGQLAEGALLPPIRNLAAQLSINPNTVARAYDELASTGVVRKRQGSGCYVTGVRSPRLAREERMKPLLGLIEELVADARRLGISLTDLIEELKRHGPVDMGTISDRREKITESRKGQEFAEISSNPANLWQPVDTLLD